MQQSCHKLYTATCFLTEINSTSHCVSTSREGRHESEIHFYQIANSLTKNSSVIQLSTLPYS